MRLIEPQQLQIRKQFKYLVSSDLTGWIVRHFMVSHFHSWFLSCMTYQFHRALAKMLCQKDRLSCQSSVPVRLNEPLPHPIIFSPYIKKSKMHVQPSALFCGPAGRTTIYRYNGITNYEFWNPKRLSCKQKSAHHFDSYPSPSCDVLCLNGQFEGFICMRFLTLSPLPSREWPNLRPYDWRASKFSQMYSGCVAMCSHV